MLELEGLRRTFGEVVALDGLTFTVPDGVLFGFVGRNGSGKTTAMRIVCGLLEPDAGEVRWHDRPPDRAARQRFGYMPEERGLYARMRAVDQLAYLAELRGRSRLDARAAALSWLERLGLGERADERIERLSLGNQQRVQLAAALVHEPHLLVLDEPFSGLDPIAAGVMAEILGEQAAAGVPVLFSSHQLELVERLCSHVAIIDRGRVVAAGDVGELRRRATRRHLVRVEADAPPDGWLAQAGDVTVVDREAGAIILELRDGADTQRVLDAARAAGPVRFFGEVRPTLAELFRETVAA